MDFIFIIIILIMSVVVHEVAHGFAALALGDTTAKYQGRLTLNPIAHLDPVGSFIVPLLGYMFGGFIIGWAKPVPFNPYNLRSAKWGEALVALAGPLSNILLAVVFGTVLRFVGEGSNLTGALGFVVLINITLAIFNLIPIPPLDGSKILFSVLPLRMQGFRRSIEQYGILLVILMITFIWSVMSPIIMKIFTLITGL